jgi:hypothetical protein
MLTLSWPHLAFVGCKSPRFLYRITNYSKLWFVALSCRNRWSYLFGYFCSDFPSTIHFISLSYSIICSSIANRYCHLSADLRRLLSRILSFPVCGVGMTMNLWFTLTSLSSIRAEWSFGAVLGPWMTFRLLCDCFSSGIHSSIVHSPCS